LEFNAICLCRDTSKSRPVSLENPLILYNYRMKVDAKIYPNMPPILDFEASSLNAFWSYPISVGLVLGGRSYYWEIAPKPEWTDWSAASEKIHGLSLSYLQQYGQPADKVCRQVQEVIGNNKIIYSDQPDWERIWAKALGLQNIEIRDVRSLVRPHEESMLADIVVHYFESGELQAHNSQDDAIAIVVVK
jgi:hypothetical protein